MHAIDTRIEVHPALDLWMKGARYGTVVGHKNGDYRVDMDKLPRIITLHPSDILKEI